MTRLGRGRIAGRIAPKTTGTGGGGTVIEGVPAGAAVMSETFTATIKAEVSETIAAQTDAFTGRIRGNVTETNAAQTDAWKVGLSGPGLNETNATPGDSFGGRAIFATSGSWQVPLGVTSLTATGWGAGRAGSGGTSLAAGAGGAGADFVTNTFAVTPGETLTITVAPQVAGAAANGTGNPGTNSTVSRGGTTLWSARGGGSAGGTNVGTATTGGAASGATGGAGANGGGAGGAAATGTGAGGAGSPPGGGGGGGGANLLGTPGAGGAGARGEVRLGWS